MDGITVSTIDYEANLQERTLFEGFCPLEYTSDNHWVTEFTFNISNDGSRFTDIYFVYTYQSLCQEYQNNTGTVTFLFKVHKFEFMDYGIDFVYLLGEYFVHIIFCLIMF